MADSWWSRARKPRRRARVMAGHPSFAIASLAAVVQLTRGLPSLRSLELRNISDAGVTALGKGLKETPAVQTSLNVLRNSIAMDAAVALAAVLHQHKTLKTLCGLKPDQTEAIFRYLRRINSESSRISRKYLIPESQYMRGWLGNILV